MVTKHYKNLERWPAVSLSFFGPDKYIPVCKVDDCQHFIEILNDDPYFNSSAGRIFRGQRRFDWGLTPSIARLSEGFYKEKWATIQLEEFKYSIRGRTKHSLSEILEKEGDKEEEKKEKRENLWALGQHYGLMTPLLDWSHSPYVALFFAISEKDLEADESRNYSRVIFCINKTELENLGLNEVFVNPLKSEHDRLTSQDGLFTLSPSGQVSLEMQIIDQLGENGINVDNAKELKEYFLKIYIPMQTEGDRLKHMETLRKMNIHYGNLLPDLLGSSKFCNEKLQELVRPNKDEVISSLVNSRNYSDSIKYFSELEDIEDLTEAEIEEIVRRYNGNKQLYDCYIINDNNRFANFLSRVSGDSYDIVDGKLQKIDDEEGL